MHTWNEALMIGMGDGLKKIAASKKSGTIHVPSANVPGPGENLGKLMAQIKAKSKPTEVKLPGTEGKTATASVKPPPKKVEIPKQTLTLPKKSPVGWKPTTTSLSEEGKLSQASFEEAKAGFERGFADELSKMGISAKPTYPISRFVTHPGGAAAIQALTRIPEMATNPLSPLAGAITGGSVGALDRLWHSRGMLGRVRKGGGALFGHEKRRLAEATGMSLSELESALERAAKSSKGKPTYPISRFMTHWAQIGPLWTRLFHGRGVAGRAAKGGGALWKGERGALEELKGHAPLLSAIKSLVK